MRRALLLLSGSVVVGVVFGRVMSQIPSPRDVHVFWIGNLCAPWLVLAFFAGRVQLRCAWAVLAGVVTDVGCVTGFYSEFLFLPVTAYGLPPGTSIRSVVVTDVARWLVFIAPWLAAAVVGGLVYGLLGWWWRTRRPLVAALAVSGCRCWPSRRCGRWPTASTRARGRCGRSRSQPGWSSSASWPLDTDPGRWLSLDPPRRVVRVADG